MAEWTNAAVSKTAVASQRPEVRILPLPNMKKYKLVVFVPVRDAEKVREAIHAAGGGKLGKYSHCSFSSRGVGRFKPETGACPAIGEIGKVEEVEEERIEILCEEKVIHGVIVAMRATHPYEEPAFDVYEVEDLILKAMTQ